MNWREWRRAREEKALARKKRREEEVRRREHEERWMDGNRLIHLKLKKEAVEEEIRKEKIRAQYQSRVAEEKERFRSVKK